MRNEDEIMAPSHRELFLPRTDDIGESDGFCLNSFVSIFFSVPSNPFSCS